MLSPYEVLQLQVCDTKTIVHWFMQKLSPGSQEHTTWVVMIKAMCENCKSPHQIVGARLSFYKPAWEDNILCIWSQKGPFLGPGDSCHGPCGRHLDRFPSLLPKKHTISTRPLKISPCSWHHPALHQESQENGQNSWPQTCIY